MPLASGRTTKIRIKAANSKRERVYKITIDHHEFCEYPEGSAIKFEDIRWVNFSGDIFVRTVETEPILVNLPVFGYEINLPWIILITLHYFRKSEKQSRKIYNFSEFGGF